MIIECPACITKYDIKATLPPQGRTVRCAKCGTVWRAMPDAAGEIMAADEAVPDHDATPHRDAWDGVAEEQANGMSAEAAPQSEATASEWETGGAVNEAFDGGQGGDMTADNPERASYSEMDVKLSELALSELASAVGETLPNRQDRYIAQEPSTPDLDIDESGAGKVKWFGGFRRKKTAKNNLDAFEDAAGKAGRTGIAETIPFPGMGIKDNRPPLDTPEEEIRTLEEARDAVRGVFSSLGDLRAPTSSRSFAMPVTSAPEEAPILEEAQAETRPQFAPADEYLETAAVQNNWFEAIEKHQAASPDHNPIDFSGGGEEVEEDTYERPVTSDLASRFSNGHPGVPQVDKEWNGLDDEVQERSDDSVGPAWQEKFFRPSVPDAVDEGESDPDASLRDAMRGVLHPSGEILPGGLAPEQESGLTADRALAQDLETHLRSKADSGTGSRAWAERAASLWKRPSLPLDELAEPSRVADDDAKEGRDDEVSFDPRLYREIEETRDHAVEARRREGRGGLAVAAGWGLFLCAAVGLVAGFFAFRDMLADTMPGLAALYRTMGLPVTVQPLIFESVQYEWKTAENKAVLVVTGSVYNRAQRKVRVPDFYITIKDQDPALDREYSANLQVSGSKIKADKRADFEIELLSPNPSITSVELELRNVR